MLQLSMEALWLLIGAALVVMGAFVAPGVGLLFAGIGAIIAGLLVGFGVIATDNIVLQFAVFFAFTALTARLLWKKLKQFRQGKESYSNIVGDSAVVQGAALQKDKIGKVKWSGTTLSAQLSQSSTMTEIAVGQDVVIEKLQGNIAICKPFGEKS